MAQSAPFHAYRVRARSRSSFATIIPTSRPPALRKVTDLFAKGRSATPTSITWQAECFSYMESIGEVGYVLHLKANAVAACDLAVMEAHEPDEENEADEVASTDDRVLRVLEALRGPLGDRQALMGRAALHLEAAGETYLVGTEPDQGGGIQWEFLSTEELKPDGMGRIRRIRTARRVAETEYLPEDAYVDRLYRPDGRYSDDPDCALRRVRAICNEVIVLTQLVDAVAKTRLSSGILYVPDEITFLTDDVSEPGTPLAPEYVSDQAEIDKFTDDLIKHMSAPVEDRTSAASLVPLILRGPGDQKENLGIIELARDLDDWAKDLRQEALGRLGAGLDIPPETMAGKGGLNHWCNTESVELLTPEGWRGIDAIDVGSTVLTLDHSTGLSSWQEAEHVYRAEVVDHPMIRVRATSPRGGRTMHDSLTTVDHRWPIIRENERIIVQSQQLRPGDDLILGAPHPGLPTQAKYDDAFVELVAWYSADGTRIGTTPQVRIGKSHARNPDKVARLHRLFTDLYGPAHEGPIPQSLRRDDVARWTLAVEDHRGMTLFCPNKAAAAALLGLVPGKDKVVPLSFVRDLTAAQLRLFLNAWLDSDGMRPTSTGGQIGQKVEARLDAVELAAILLGHGTRRWIKESGGFGRFALHMLSIRAITTARVTEVLPETHTGRIWCPTVPNGTTFARDNGHSYVTGNSAYVVDADFISKHVQPLGQLIASFLTDAYLRPMLIEQEGMSEDEATKYRFAFDDQNIAVKQDEAENARLLYDRYELSAAALRRYNGMEEGDAPDEDEFGERLLRELVLKQPEKLLYLLEALGIEVPEPPPPEPMPGMEPVPGEEQEQPEAGSGGPSQVDPADGGEPEGTPGDVDRAVATIRLVDRVALTADAYLERALERAGSRIVSKLNGSDKRRVAEADKATLLGAFDEHALRAMGESYDTLLDWSRFRSRVKPWLADWMTTTRGVDTLYASAKADKILDALCEHLTRLAALGGEEVWDNGLRVPDDAVIDALSAGTPARL